MNNLELVIIDQEKFDQRQLLPADIKQQWLDALRSGKYKQCGVYLNYDNHFCCLGVLCEIQERPKTRNDEYSETYYDSNNCGLNENNPLFSILGDLGYFEHFYFSNPDVELDVFESLAQLNDGGYSFEDIAYIIEKYF